MKLFFSGIYSLWVREMVRFYRQPSRVVGALGSPLIFWLLIGSGLGDSFRVSESAPAMNYLKYFFPGTLLLILLFTAIFSTFSLIEDRKEGFLQGVLVSPAPRSAVVIGKILGGSSLAFQQSVLFLFFAPMAGIAFTWIGILKIFIILFACAFSITTLGFILAWKFDSTQGFHAVVNLFLLPLWLMSGALFPESGAHGWIQWVMRLNPMFYEYHLLRQELLPELNFAISGAMAQGVTLVFMAGLLWIAVRMGGRRSAKDLR